MCIISSSEDAKESTVENPFANTAVAEESPAELMVSPPPSNNDLVIRDGFPALRLPANGGPNIDGEEPLPRHQFWASETALNFLEPAHWDALVSDCEIVFTARTRESDQAYSVGTTYFLPCQMKPRCALEALVHSIFTKHTASLDPTTFVPEQSGAEWWSLVMDGVSMDDDDDDDDVERRMQSDDSEVEDDDDEVGWHFDADYGLEAQAPDLLLHPRLATVTYLTDYGSPTVVLDLRSPPPGDTEKKTLQGSIRKAWVSMPKKGKHVAFDGRLLHGAPSTYFPPGLATRVTAKASLPLSDEPPRKKAKQLPPTLPQSPHKRITLLVNIWLNHCPLDAELLDDDVIAQFQTPWKTTDTNSSTTGTTTNDDSLTVPLFSWYDLDLEHPTACQKVSLSASQSDPAGTEEVVICGRLVTVNYGASMSDFRNASTKNGGLVELELGPDVISLVVGDKVEDEESDEDEEEEE